MSWVASRQILDLHRSLCRGRRTDCIHQSREQFLLRAQVARVDAEVDVEADPTAPNQQKLRLQLLQAVAEAVEEVRS